LKFCHDYVVTPPASASVFGTEAFWNEVDKVLPDYLDRKQWLRVNGAGMSL
jgi:hypothetical protein